MPGPFRSGIVFTPDLGHPFPPSGVFPLLPLGTTHLVDAGPLYAYVDADDRRHEECLRLLRRHPGPLIVPVLVITEAAYFIGTRLGAKAEVRFLGDLASGDFTIEPVRAGDWLRITELVYRYRDASLGTVDASVVATAERLGVSTIMTLDRRDFSIVQPAHTPSFELIP